MRPGSDITLRPPKDASWWLYQAVPGDEDLSWGPVPGGLDPASAGWGLGQEEAEAEKVGSAVMAAVITSAPWVGAIVGFTQLVTGAIEGYKNAVVQMWPILSYEEQWEWARLRYWATNVKWYKRAAWKDKFWKYCRKLTERYDGITSEQVVKLAALREEQPGHRKKSMAAAEIYKDTTPRRSPAPTWREDLAAYQVKLEKEAVAKVVTEAVERGVITPAEAAPAAVALLKAKRNEPVTDTEQELLAKLAPELKRQQGAAEAGGLVIPAVLAAAGAAAYALT